LLSWANTWDTELVEEFGRRVAQEFKDKGAGVYLGPGLNVQRIPTDGRNYEYLSGEDPVLGAKLAPHIIKGVQSNGVIAVMKHYINNNQETNRQQQSANIDERT